MTNSHYDLILHRANTRKRIQTYAGYFKRLEVDIWAHGNFRICHDRTLGPLVVGQNGVALSANKRQFVRWQWPYLTLHELLIEYPLPLLIDLKGQWPDKELRRLSSFLSEWHADDIICCPDAEILKRCTNWISCKIVLSEAHRYTREKLFDVFPQNSSLWGVSVDAQKVISRTDLIRGFRNDGLKVYAWNVRSQAMVRYLNHVGIDGLIVDTPLGLLPEHLSR